MYINLCYNGIMDSLDKAIRKLESAKERKKIAKDILIGDPSMSNGSIAESSGLSIVTVSKLRAEMETSGEIPKLDKMCGRDGKWYSRTKHPRHAKVSVLEEIDLDDLARDRIYTELVQAKSIINNIASCLPERTQLNSDFAKAIIACRKIGFNQATNTLQKLIPKLRALTDFRDDPL